MRKLMLAAAAALMLVATAPTTAQTPTEVVAVADTLGDSQTQTPPNFWYGNPYDWYDDYTPPATPWYKGLHLPGLGN